MKEYDYLIVGSGLFGATYAYLCKHKGKKCLVIDKRPTRGGNVYCEHRNGINVHKYGAHIFHTSNKKVWEFVNSLVEFNRYTNSPIANYKGQLYNLPFNMNTFNQMWGIKTPEEAQAIIDKQKSVIMEQLDGRNPENLEEQALLLVGTDIYTKLVKGYTEKQWGRSCSELPAFIIRRLPVRYVYDNNYFNDLYQGIPIRGYNKLIDKLLDGVEVRLETDFLSDRAYWNDIAEKIVYTGKIDEFYGYSFGRLEYRSLRFEEDVINVPNYQGNAVVNYTDAETPYTRIIEHKHFECFGQEIYANKQTIITREYPQGASVDCEPFYPINDGKNQSLYHQYSNFSKKDSRVIFGGRLGEYKYYDMDKVIESAFERFEQNEN